MAYVNMYQELTGCVPKLPLDYSKTLINRAWRDVRRQNLWSFQLYEGNWVSPALINTGTVTTVQGASTVTFNAAASTAIAAVSAIGPFPTNLLQRQFRVGISTIYNIWAYSNSGGIVTLTLDRPYTDASVTASPYTIFQCYYPAPYQDHLLWINVRDIVNFNDLVIYSNRKQVDMMDPQRTIYYLPTYVVAYQQLQNPNVVTYGVPTFELWGQPQYPITYQLMGIRKGTALVNDTDTLPYAVGEDAVMALSRAYAYEWAEGTKGDLPRNQGSDFKFLMGAALAEYKRLIRDYRRQDRETTDNWYEIRRRPTFFANVYGYYSSIGGTANPGASWIAILIAGLSAWRVFSFASHFLSQG